MENVKRFLAIIFLIVTVVAVAAVSVDGYFLAKEKDMELITETIMSTLTSSPTVLDDNSATYFKDVFGVDFSLITDETPSLYDKNHGIGQFPYDFSWKDNPDLLVKVNEITNGLTDDKQKAEAIGAWVANSRVYADPSVLSSGDETTKIYSIFKATYGICIDAAYLTTAMLRLADIPARPVSPMVFLSPTHEYTEFYYKGEWYGLDSTFGTDTSGGMSPKAFKISTPIEVINNIEIPVSKQIIQKNPFSNDEIFVYNVKKIIQPITISKKEIPIKWGYLKVINPAMHTQNRLDVEYETIYSWVEPMTQSCYYYYCSSTQSGGVGFNINSGLQLAGEMLTYRDGNLIDITATIDRSISSTNAQVYEIPLPPGKYRYWFGDDFVYEDIKITSDETTFININGLVNNKLSTTEFDGFKANLSEQISLYNSLSAADVNTDFIPEGALIRAIGDIDVFVVKYINGKKFKRLILSPSVFNSYGHLRWNDVMDIAPEIVNAFTASDLVRATVAGDPRVYRLYPDGDTGEKHWIKTETAFIRLGYDWDAIYTINETDRNSYIEKKVIE